MSIKIKYFDSKMFEELKFDDREESQNTMPVILTEEDIPKLSKIINFLNNKDKDIAFLMHVSGKTQTDMVELLNRSQPSLSYDLKKIKNRISFITYLHKQFVTFLDWLQYHSEGYTCEQVMIMTLMYFTTSFSHSSKVSGLKPARVRYVFDKTLKYLKTQPGEKIAFELFEKIRQNLNSLRREYVALSTLKQRRM